jgi:deazaflavin-dependent oxidoreductase (nitroreductase family)
MTAFNDRVIAQFRSNSGEVDGFGSQLVLLHTRGARTGAERVNPAMSLRDGEGWLVVASAMGAERDPAWMHNLRANPDVTIEAAMPTGVSIVPVRAQELHGRERDAAFNRFVAHAPAFRNYQDRTKRARPVIRLQPRRTDGHLALQSDRPGGVQASETRESLRR